MSQSTVLSRRTLARARLGALLSLLGVGLSLVLLRTHLTNGSGGCSGFAMSCASVILSPYGHAFGLPLPVLLIPYYFAGATSFWFASRDVRLHVPLKIGAALAIGPSVWLLGVSARVLEAYCPVCLSLDVINVGMVIAAFGLRADGSIDDASTHSPLRLLLRCLAPPLVFLVVLVLFTLRHERRDDAREAESPAHGLDARVVERPAVEVYLNPTCPHCARLFGPLVRWLRAQDAKGSASTLVVHLAPADQECFASLTVSTPRPVVSDPASCRAAAWVYCASQQGKTTEMLMSSFSRVLAPPVGNLSRARLDSAAVAAGLDLAELARCTGDRGPTWSVAKMPDAQRAAFAAHVRASVQHLLPGLEVPRVEVNGRKLDLAQGAPVAQLAQALSPSP